MISILGLPKLMREYEAATDEYEFWNRQHVEYALDRQQAAKRPGIVSDRINSYFNNYWDDMPPMLRAGVESSSAELASLMTAISNFYGESKINKFILDNYVRYGIIASRRKYYVKILTP